MVQVLLVFLASLLVIGSEPRNASALPSSSLQEYEGLFFKSLFQRLTHWNLMEALGKDALKDPVTLPPFSFDFSYLPTSENLTLAGTLDVCDASVSGLSKIDPYTRVKPTNFTYVDVTVGIYTETIRIVGKHDLALEVTQGGQLSSVVGSGNFELELVGAKFVAELVIKVNASNNKFRIHDLSLHLGFDCIAINMDGTTLDGAEIDWVAFSRGFKTTFDNYWNSKRAWIAGLAELALNMVMSECTVADTMPLNFTECIGDALFPDPKDTLTATKLLEDFLEFHNTGVSSRDMCSPVTQPPLATPTTLPRATCDWLYEKEESSTDAPGAASTLSLGRISLLAILAVAIL